MDESEDISESEITADGEQAELEAEESFAAEDEDVAQEDNVEQADDKPDRRPTIKKKATKKNAKVNVNVDIGIDCEYQTVTRIITDKKTKEPRKRSFNRILSYQWFGVIDVDGIANEWSGWHLPDLPVDRNDPGKKSRIKLEKWIALAIEDGIKQGAVPSWPKRATIFSHFLRAELGSVKDFAEQKDSFKAVGGTVYRKGKAMEMPDSERLSQKRYKPYKMSIYNDARNKREVFVRFVDTMLVTPARSGLAVAGGMIGIEKGNIPEPYSIEEMEMFLTESPESFKAFMAYAIKDAEIAVKYGRWMRQFCKNELNIPNLTVTIAAMGLRLLEQTLTDDRSKGWRERAQERRRELFGYHSVAQERFDLANHRVVKSRKQDIPVFSRLVRERFATEAYHGGRNESFVFGPTEEGVWTDYDLKAAYTTAMCIIRPLDYESSINLGRGFDPKRIKLSDVGCARVKFNFNTASKRAKRFPCLPVRTQFGLVYPLEGESIATMPEIYLATRVGATIEVLDGLIVPIVSEAAVFEDFSAKVNGMRSQLKKQIRKANDELKKHDAGAIHTALSSDIVSLSAREKLWKEIGNSLYGKTAQGVKDKMAFDPRIGMNSRVPPSDITNPFFAAQVTGYVRAILSEILIALPLSCRVVSATTDGLLCDMPKDKIKLYLSGPLCHHYAKLRKRIFEDNEPILEVKHSVAQVISMRTRGQITSREIQGEKIVLARAGVKPDIKIPYGLSSDEIQGRHNKEMLRLFMTRVGGEKIRLRQLISLGEMWKTEADLVNIDRERLMNLEYDFKRQPIGPRMVAVAKDEGEHLALDTVAWKNVEDMTAARLSIDSWRVGLPGKPASSGDDSICSVPGTADTGRPPRALKTVNDYHEFNEFHNKRHTASIGGMRARAGQDIVDLAVRTFLRAFKKNAWGTDNEEWSHADIASFLTTAGFEVGKRDVSSASRYDPREINLPTEPRIIELMATLISKFPNLELERFFSHDDAEFVRREVLERRRATES